MGQLFWEKAKSKKFNLSNIENKVKADKLFASFLLEVEEKGIESLQLKKYLNLYPEIQQALKNILHTGFLL